mgnify:CR=1 FL=1
MGDNRDTDHATTPTDLAELSTDGVDHHDEPRSGTGETKDDGQNLQGGAPAPTDGGDKLRQPGGKSDDEDDL